MTFTKATRSDIPKLITIFNSATEYKLSKDDNSWGSEPWSENEVGELVDKDSTYLVEIDGVPAATVTLTSEDGTWQDPALANYVKRLAVVGNLHGRGIGSEILAWAEARTLEDGKHLLRLDCDSANSNLCKYYENQGFSLVRTVEKKYAKNGASTVTALFEKQLTI